MMELNIRSQVSGDLLFIMRLDMLPIVQFKIRATRSRAASFLSNTKMAHPDQWGAHDQAHDVSRLGPYTKNPLSVAAYDQRNLDTGALVYADRFKPRARIKDPFFLITFVAQVLYHMNDMILYPYLTHERSPVVLTWLRRLVISIWHQFAGFCVVSALALSTWISQGGLGGGLGDSTGTSVTLNRYSASDPNGDEADDLF
jgi:hypothetical protein